MAKINPHVGTSQAILNDMKKNGWTVKKGKLLMGASKRMVRHRQLGDHGTSGRSDLRRK